MQLIYVYLYFDIDALLVYEEEKAEFSFLPVSRNKTMTYDAAAG